MLKMEGLSKKEIKMVADLEFHNKYYFTREDISKHFDSKMQMKDTLYTLRKKGRIISLNRNKYFLVPVKAPNSKWTDHPLIVVDEMFNSQDYIVGGWYAAWYWKLTNQVPMQMDVYTTKRQGEKKLLNKRYVFHRTTKSKIAKAIVRKIGDHTFRVLSLEETKKWFMQRK